MSRGITAKMRIAIAGSSGLVGTALVGQLADRGDSVATLVRGQHSARENEILWDPATSQLDPATLENHDAAIHLGGAGIADKRWSSSRKQLIRESRIESTRLLSKTIANLANPPRTFICASAVGYYGDRGDEILTEESPAGAGFLPEVCQQWEQAAQPARDAGVRVLNLRIGVVLSTAGGALRKMLTPFKLGLGGVLGHGRQYMSWITLSDLVSAILFTLDNAELSGPVNATAPNPVTNREFTKTLAKVIRRPTILPAPAFLIRAALGEMGQRLLLEGCRAVPHKLEAAGFEFENATLETALRAELAKST